jgi:purine-nucleoside phosphorylase
MPARRAAGRGAPPARVLVLSAWEPELAALRAGIADTPGLGKRVTLGAAGVGLVEAAIGAERALAGARPEIVIFVGTAGRYGAGAPLGGAVVARKLRLASSAVARGDGYLPEILPAVAEADVRLRRALARRVPVVDVACPLAITRSARLGRQLAAATGCAVETLEAFAVARAAAAHDVAFAAVLGISNDVGPSAHAQWRTHATAAAAAACDVVMRWLRIARSQTGRRPHRRSRSATPATSPAPRER